MKRFQLFDYINWKRNNKDEETGKYREPKRIITKGLFRKIEELSEEEKEEERLYYWLYNNPNKIKKIKKYANADISKMPRRYKNIRIRFKDIKFNTMNYENYLKWIIEHKNNEKGKVYKPSPTIYRNEIILSYGQMTFEERYQQNLAIWWRNESKERRIIRKFEDEKLEDIPEEFREIVRKYREAIKPLEKVVQMVRKGLDEDMYLKYLECKKQLIKKSGFYREPRTDILAEDGRRKSIEEMTEEEREEYRIGRWWTNKPVERRILEKNLYITNDDFYKLPDEHKRVIILYYQSGIKDKYNIIERMNIDISMFLKENIKTKKKDSIVEDFEDR